MPGTNLQHAVQSTLSSFLQQRISTNGDIAQDVYRTLRDEASLLLERQLVCDALDLDPFELMKISSGKGECTEDDDADDGAKDRGENGIGHGGSAGEKNMDEIGVEDDLSEKEKNRKLIARVKVRSKNI